MMSKTEAERIGHEVLDKLGLGWQAHVWENLGYHVKWINGAVQLHYNEHTLKHFSVLIGQRGGGHMDLNFSQSYSSPVRAVREACRHAEDVFVRLWRPIMDSAIIAMKTVGMSGDIRAERRCQYCGYDDFLDATIKTGMDGEYPDYKAVAYIQCPTCGSIIEL